MSIENLQDGEVYVKTEEVTGGWRTILICKEGVSRSRIFNNEDDADKNTMQLIKIVSEEFHHCYSKYELEIVGGTYERGDA